MDGLRLPSCRTPISVSIALKSSVTFVLTSPPMRSPAHCLKRPILLFTCIVEHDGGMIRMKVVWGESSQSGVLSFDLERKRRREDWRGRSEGKQCDLSTDQGVEKEEVDGRGSGSEGGKDDSIN